MNLEVALWVLVGGALMNVVMTLWRVRAERQHEAEFKQTQADVAIVLRVLIVWAQLWGRPPEDVRAALLRALGARANGKGQA